VGTPPQAAAPANFRVTDVQFVPAGNLCKIFLAWDGDSGPDSLPIGNHMFCDPPNNQHTSPADSHAGTYRYYLKRNGALIATLKDPFYVDTMSFSSALNTLFTYQVTYNTFAQNDCCAYTISNQGPPASLYVMIDKIPTVAAASVDSRLDYRKNPVALRNYRFGYSLYKGGLFVGSIDDPSKVARTYLKFNVPLPPYNPTDGLWSAHLYGYINANHEDSVDYVTDPMNPPTASVTIRTHFCSDATWLQNGIHWSNAPAFNATPTASVLVPISLYNLGQWLDWRIDADVAARTGSALTEVLKAADETQKSWKYFAKKEYSHNHQPFILRATGKNTTPP